MKVLTVEKFSNEVKNLVLNGDTYIGATVAVCDKYGIDHAIANKYIDNNLKSKIQEEARALHLIKVDDESVDICL